MSGQTDKRYKKRVVITGIGMLTPYGRGYHTFWENLSQGKSAISKVEKIDTSAINVKKGGEIKWYRPEDHYSRRERTRMDITSQYLVLASSDALSDAGVTSVDLMGTNTGIFIGTLVAGLPFAEKYYRCCSRGKVSPALASQVYRSSAAHHVASWFDISGPCMTITTACSASAHAVGLGADYIRAGKIDLAVIGGVDAFCEITWGGFFSLKSLSPGDISPFDKNRSGILLGEGSGVLVLESEERALARKARIYGEVLGYGASCDAHHSTAPDPEGYGPALAIRLAIKSAGIKLEEIDYINAHGTATKHNDVAETNAIKLTFGEIAYSVPVSSTKSMIGHMLGAAGIIEVIAVLGMIRDQVIYPTINYLTPDPECDLNYVPNKSVRASIEKVLSNSFGFGGNNAVLALSKYRRH